MSKSPKKTSLSLEDARAVSGAVEKILAALPIANPVEIFITESAGLEIFKAEIVAGIAKLRQPDVLEFLYALKNEIKEKPVLKSIKKGIFTLENAGIKAEKKAADKSKGLIKPAEEKKAIGFLTPCETFDLRFGFLALPKEPKGLNVFSFLTSFKKGLGRFDSFEQTMGEFNRMVKGFLRDFEGAFIDVPPGQVRYVLDEAAQRTRNLGLTMPEGFGGYVTLARMVDLPDAPLAYDLVESETSIEPARLESVARNLLSHKYLETWTSIAEVEPYVREIADLDTSVLVLSEGQKQDRRQPVIIEAAREIFDEDKKFFLRRALEETALLLWINGELEDARAALELAKSLDKQPSLIMNFDFGMMLVEQAINELMSRIGSHDASVPQEEVTESGLILPGGMSR